MSNGRHFLQGVSLLVAAAALSPAHSQEPWRDIYFCGPSTGHSYFMNGVGWSADAISKGTIVLRQRGTEFDVQIGDATGGHFSALEDGARVIVREEGGAVQALVVYPKLTIETYLFSAPSGGQSTVAWTSSKRSGIADRASVFVSSCRAR